MSKPNIYTVGGAGQAGGGLYIQRQADNELLKLCHEGAFAYVLTSRQVGKSSLMVRTAEQLAEEGIRSVIVDLTVFGVQVTAEAWYLGLLTAISDRLNLQTDVIEWWRNRAQFGGAKIWLWVGGGALASTGVTYLLAKEKEKDLPEPPALP